MTRKKHKDTASRHENYERKSHAAWIGLSGLGSASLCGHAIRQQAFPSLPKVLARVQRQKRNRVRCDALRLGLS